MPTPPPPEVRAICGEHSGFDARLGNIESMLKEIRDNHLEHIWEKVNQIVTDIALLKLKQGAVIALSALLGGAIGAAVVRIVTGK